MSDRMTIHHSSTGFERNSEIAMTGRFVPTVDVTRDDEDTSSHVSDIPFAASRECKCFI